ncbi:MAG: PP2C family protein-serine/threonine phosphatase, partial [Ktedonobacterales bacterium]
EMQFDLFTQKLQPGMRLLLCSDGLWEMVRDDELARILGEAGDPQEACDELVRAANQQGGEDNVTAVVIEVRA